MPLHSKKQSIIYLYLYLYKTISLLIFISCFTLIPEILKILWPSLIETASRIGIGIGIGSVDVWMYVLISIISNVLPLVLFNGFMWMIYTQNIVCFQRFRVSEKAKWPWQIDSGKWKKMICKTVALVGFNAVIVNFILTYG